MLRRPRLREQRTRSRGGTLRAHLARRRLVERRLGDESFSDEIARALQRLPCLPQFGIRLIDVRLRNLDRGG